jgi:hypothetical protein
VDFDWFASKVQEILGKTHIDSTHLPIVLTDNVMLADMKSGRCCTIGFHGTSSTSGNGKQQVQTYIFAAYSTEGIFSTTQYIADIHALSHEVAEWADDPFVNNAVNPWLTATLLSASASTSPGTPTTRGTRGPTGLGTPKTRRSSRGSRARRRTPPRSRRKNRARIAGATP